jgi:hypothetical protein
MMVLRICWGGSPLRGRDMRAGRNGGRGMWLFFWPRLWRSSPQFRAVEAPTGSLFFSGFFWDLEPSTVLFLGLSRVDPPRCHGSPRHLQPQVCCSRLAMAREKSVLRRWTSPSGQRQVMDGGQRDKRTE